MKVILSRKGFDSTYGGKPSPILPDGRLVSLPIPSPQVLDASRRFTYDDLQLRGIGNYGMLMSDLGLKVPPHCHIDPDLEESLLNRPNGWRPLFGQVGAAAKHLRNQGVGPGDLFLFFGWFRHIENIAGRLRYDPADPGCHVLFGFLQVEEVIRLEAQASLPSWAEYHPHADMKLRLQPSNDLFVSAPHLIQDPDLPGAGTFYFGKELVLTRSNSKRRSEWQLPDFIRNLRMSYHTPSSWKESHFQSASRGQEFVIEESDELAHWAINLIKRHVPTSVSPPRGRPTRFELFKHAVGKS